MRKTCHFSHCTCGWGPFTVLFTKCLYESPRPHSSAPCKRRKGEKKEAAYVCCCSLSLSFQVFGAHGGPANVKEKAEKRAPLYCLLRRGNSCPRQPKFDVCLDAKASLSPHFPMVTCVAFDFRSLYLFFSKISFFFPPKVLVEYQKAHGISFFSFLG